MPVRWWLSKNFDQLSFSHLIWPAPKSVLVLFGSKIPLLYTVLMANWSQVLASKGLETWTHVSENTREYLAQVPWIREKVQPQNKDAHALFGAGVWSESPRTSRVDREGDVDSINLDDIVPEFSIRRTDTDEPGKKPIGEVLSDVRETLNSMKVRITVVLGKYIAYFSIYLGGDEKSKISYRSRTKCATARIGIAS